jgi:hypothetical protein
MRTLYTRRERTKKPSLADCRSQSANVLFLLFPPSASLPLCYPLLFAQLRLYLSYPKVPCLLLNGDEDLYPVKLALRARNIC